MNKFCLFITFLFLQTLSMQASHQKVEIGTYTYQWGSQNPTQIIKTDLKTNKQEIIPVAPGENGQEKINKLMTKEAAFWLSARQKDHLSKNK